MTSFLNRRRCELYWHTECARDPADRQKHINDTGNIIETFLTGLSKFSATKVVWHSIEYNFRIITTFSHRAFQILCHINNTWEKYYGVEQNTILKSPIHFLQGFLNSVPHKHYLRKILWHRIEYNFRIINTFSHRAFQILCHISST